MRGCIAAISPGMASALNGIAVGLACAAAATRTMSSLLFGVSPNDALTFVSVPVLLSVVALVACLIPGLRATRVRPIEAIRC
jgi:putative ABC transport system permease protein